MAAPTPVSALVHSSTLVTAGVYILIRFSPAIPRRIRTGLAWVGCLTMVMSGLGANFEEDMKKVVALSTLSQLGLIVLTVGLGAPLLAFFHLLTHALFKSRLFICAGVIIHSSNGKQDFRSMGGFRLARPALGLALGVTNMALCGVPFLAGFYSKDLVLEGALRLSERGGLLFIAMLGTGLTVSYRIRFIYEGARSIRSLTRVSTLVDLDRKTLKRVVNLLVLRCVGGFVISWLVY